MRVFLVFIFILFSSCGYYKDSEVYRPIMSDESYYMLRVFRKFELTNSGALIIYKISMKEITDKKIDSINKEADKFIQHCLKIDKQ